MVERNPMVHILDQMGDILRRIQEYKEPISTDLTPEIYKQFEELECALKLFEELHQQLFQSAQIDREALKLKPLESFQISERDKTLLERARQIEKDARDFERQLSLAIHKTRQGQRTKTIGKKQVKSHIKKSNLDKNKKGWVSL